MVCFCDCTGSSKCGSQELTKQGGGLVDEIYNAWLLGASLSLAQIGLVVKRTRADRGTTV